MSVEENPISRQGEFASFAPHRDRRLHLWLGVSSRIEKTALQFLLTFALCISADAQSTAQEWQAKAAAKYPELSTKGSSLNKRFVEAYAERKKANPGFFNNPQWPLLLADELASTAQPPAVPAAAAKARELKPRIGATAEDFRKSAGAYIGDYKGVLGSTILIFRLGGYDMHAAFWGGRCHRLEIMDSVMSDAPGSARPIIEFKQLGGQYEPFIKSVLEANAGGADWKEIQLTDKIREWKRSDGAVTARYFAGHIELTTKQFADAIGEANEKQEKRALDGFY